MQSVSDSQLPAFIAFNSTVEYLNEARTLDQEIAKRVHPLVILSAGKKKLRPSLHSHAIIQRPFLSPPPVGISIANAWHCGDIWAVLRNWMDLI